MNSNDEEKYVAPEGGDLDKKDRKSLDFYFKMTIVAAGVILVFAIILGSYFWNLIFNPEGFNVKSWLERIVFLIIIALVMMVLGFLDLDSTLRASRRSDYSRDKGSFNEDVGSIYENDTVVYFDQFIPWYTERELRQKKIRHLTAHGISTADAENLIDYADEEDIITISGIKPGDKATEKKGEDLVKTVKRKNAKGELEEFSVVIPAIKGTDAFYVQEALSGAVKIDVEDPSYYLTDSKTQDTGKTTLERAQSTEKERRHYIKRQFITKICSMVVISVITGLLVTDSASGTSTDERNWILMQRFAAAVGGFGTGALMGVVNVSYVTRWINDKHKVVTQFIKFYKTGLFKPKTRKELDEIKIAEAKAKEEERKRNTIEPEVVDPIKPAPEVAMIENKADEVQPAGHM